MVTATRLESSSGSRDEQSKLHNVNRQAPGAVPLVDAADIKLPFVSKMANDSSIHGQKSTSNEGPASKQHPPKARAMSADRAMLRLPAAAPKAKLATNNAIGSSKSDVVGRRPSSSIVLPRAEQPVNERAIRRQRDVVYSRRKRQRKKIEVQVLRDEQLRLETTKTRLVEEGKWLQGLVCAAELEIEHQHEAENKMPQSW